MNGLQARIPHLTTTQRLYAFINQNSGQRNQFYATNLNLFEWNFKRKRLVEIWVQRAFLDRRFLLLDALSV